MPDATPKKPDGPDPDIERLSFEDAVELLESINDRIESGEIGLERSLAEYERGMRLIKHCRAILDRAEERIAELTPDDTEAGGAGAGSGGGAGAGA